MKRGRGAAARDHLDDALPDPGRELEAKCNLSGLVALPAGVWSTGVSEWQAGLGHGHAAFDNRGADCVKRAQQALPLGGGRVHRHDVTWWVFLQADVVW
jgi:hypothetical protein